MLLQASWILPDNSLSITLFISILLICSFLFISSGLLITLPLRNYGLISEKFFSIASICASCFIGYFLYIVFLLNSIMGKSICLVIYGLVFILSITYIYKIIKNYKLTIKSKDAFSKMTIRYLCIMLCVLFLSAFYNSLLFSCEKTGHLSTRFQFCSIVDTTFDNTLPLSFAKSVYYGNSQAQVSDWKSSDRPPLQSGLVLLVYPILHKIGSIEINYQIFAVFLQCLWLFALVEFFYFLKINRKIFLWIALLAITNNFIFINSVFVWPKMLSGSLVVMAFIILYISIKDGELDNEKIILISTLSTLSLLAHGGVIYTLIPMFVLAIIYLRNIISFKQIITSAIIFASLYAPWLLYQSWYGPGDRLTKWWIAGKVDLDDGSQGSVETIYFAYKDMSIVQIVHNKFENIKTLFGFISYTGPLSNKETVGKLLNSEGSYFFPSLSFSLLAVPLIIARFKKVLFLNKKPNNTGDLSQIKFAFLVGISSVFLWILLSFGPPNAPTIAYAGSYATFLIIYFSLLKIISRFKSILVVVSIISTVYFLIMQYHVMVHGSNNINIQFLLFTCVIAVFLFQFIYKNRMIIQ